MRVVLDTNVLVSAFRSPSGPCARIVRLALDDHFELCYSTPIMAEYLEVLSRPSLRLTALEVDAFLHWLDADGVLVDPAPLPPLKDVSDTKFLEAALGAGAGFLVTGNLKDFPRSPYQGLKIVGPAGFLKAWEP